MPATNTPNILDSIFAAAEQRAEEVAASQPHPTTVFDGTRKAPSEGFVPPVTPATKSLYQHQLAAVEAILDHRRLLLGLQPGMGKTAIMQTVAAALAARGERTLIVVPPSLRVSPWAQDFAADFPGVRIISTVGTKAEAIPDADVLIVGDSIVKARKDDILAWGPQHLMADEAHRLKSPKAGRAQAVREIAESLRPDAVVVMATGTLASNTAADVHHPLLITGRDNAAKVSGGYSFTKFMQEWCVTEAIRVPGGRTVQKIVSVYAEGLRQKLVQTCFVSVPREEVLDLPEREFVERSLVLNGDAAEYRRVERDFLAWVRETRGDAAANRSARAEAIARINALWKLDGKAKANAAAEYIESLTEQGEQVVVMATHVDAIAALKDRLDKAGLRVRTIVGGMSGTDKAEVVDAFQSGDLDVVIGNIKAAGVGFTLTAAAHIVFLETCWAPADFQQASDRNYRIGQKRSCVVHVLNGFGMISERIWTQLQEKAHVIDMINTGQISEISPDTVQQAVLESYGW